MAFATNHLATEMQERLLRIPWLQKHFLTKTQNLLIHLMDKYIISYIYNNNNNNNKSSSVLQMEVTLN